MAFQSDTRGRVKLVEGIKVVDSCGVYYINLSNDVISSLYLVLQISNFVRKTNIL